MSKIWFCRTCGYEVRGRGRCHVCRQRLMESPLAELAPGDEDDEVGYRLQDWNDASRGELIVGLIEANVAHRFEDEELVVGAGDEARTDDLVERITTEAARLEEEEIAALPPDEQREDVEVLVGAARRLREDPTDMAADAAVLEASAGVFMADEWARADAETWAAIGRVTRRLLAALGAEEALDDEIRMQAGILDKIVSPLLVDEEGDEDDEAEGDEAEGDEVEGDEVEGDGDDDAEAGVDDETAAGGDGDEEGRDEEGRDEEGGDEEGRDEEGGDEERDDDAVVVEDAADSEPGGGADSEGEDQEGEGTEDGGKDGESVYELPAWVPEQRAQLSLFLDEAGIPHSWEGGDLVVPLAREDEAEELFGRVEGVTTEEDEEARYRAMEALFAATDRFVNDPDSEAKATEIVRAVSDADGPTPVGIDEGQWWCIRQRARTLADSIERDASLEIVFGEATTLRDLLRALV